MIVVNAAGKCVNYRGQIKGFSADLALKGLFTFSDIFASVCPVPDGAQTVFGFFTQQPGGAHAGFADLVFLI